jgi:ribokinase
MSDGPLAVIGAINVDLVISGAALPVAGQTVIGGSFARHQGGKGGNQAVAAARMFAEGAISYMSLGREAERRVAMYGAVGADELGASARDALRREGIFVDRVRTVDGVATGVALIVVDEAGENQISVAPGANASVGDLTEALAEEAPSLVLASCEVPLEALASCATFCAGHDVPFVVNPAPASPALTELVGAASVITPNRGELIALTSIDDLEGAVRQLRASNDDLVVVVTLGAEGALLVDAEGERRVAPPPVNVVDTTGAGDCFNGVLAASLWEGRSPEESVRRAVVAATLSTRAAGAREGMPRASELDAALG